MQTKKLLGTTLALAMVAASSWPAHADDLVKNLKISGNVDVQATSANNVSDFTTRGGYDQIGNAQGRVMVNGGFDMADDVHATVGLTDNDLWFGNSHGVTPGSIAGPGSLSGTDSKVLVNLANVKIDKLFGAVDTTVGRQGYGEEGDINVYFGPYSHLYGLAVSAIDAARFDWSNDMLGVTGLFGEFSSKPASTLGGTLGAPANLATGSVNVTGLNLALKGNDMWNGGAYIWQKETHNGLISGGNDLLYVAGLKGKVSAGPVWVKAEFAKDFGTNRSGSQAVPQSQQPSTSANYDGWALKADVGAKADLGMATITPWGEFAEGSGGSHDNKNFGFASINPDYRPGGIYGYFSSLDGMSGITASADNAGVGDRAIWGLGIKGTPAAVSKLTAGVSYWDYRYQSILGENEEITALGVPGSAHGNKHLGSEADVCLTWKHSDNVSFNAGFGQFWAGGAIANLNAGSNNPATMVDGSMSVKF